MMEEEVKKNKIHGQGEKTNERKGCIRRNTVARHNDFPKMNHKLNQRK
jgi:hypothetical protein